MKKIKFMLLSLALVAVVGGALAFKAKDTNKFCTTLAHEISEDVFTCIDPNVLKCPNPVDAITTNSNIGDFVCTTVRPVAGCDNLNCETTVRQTKPGDL